MTAGKDWLRCQLRPPPPALQNLPPAKKDTADEQRRDERVFTHSWRGVPQLSAQLLLGGATAVLVKLDNVILLLTRNLCCSVGHVVMCSCMFANIEHDCADKDFDFSKHSSVRLFCLSNLPKCCIVAKLFDHVLTFETV